MMEPQEKRRRKQGKCLIEKYKNNYQITRDLNIFPNSIATYILSCFSGFVHQHIYNYRCQFQFESEYEDLPKVYKCRYTYFNLEDMREIYFAIRRGDNKVIITHRTRHGIINITRYAIYIDKMNVVKMFDPNFESAIHHQLVLGPIIPKY